MSTHTGEEVDPNEPPSKRAKLEHGENSELQEVLENETQVVREGTKETLEQDEQRNEVETQREDAAEARAAKEAAEQAEEMTKKLQGTWEADTMLLDVSTGMTKDRYLSVVQMAFQGQNWSRYTFRLWPDMRTERGLIKGRVGESPNPPTEPKDGGAFVALKVSPSLLVFTVEQQGNTGVLVDLLVSTIDEDTIAVTRHFLIEGSIMLEHNKLRRVSREARYMESISEAETPDIEKYKPILERIAALTAADQERISPVDEYWEAKMAHYKAMASKRDQRMGNQGTGEEKEVGAPAAEAEAEAPNQE
eukprot:comp15988_c0_seq1/m.13410 comp15988_c0_seq1/g.13410  ORF comp15988_c0_seq1/g.13410 comp15988_c0_seq1/m.13410 type:complete len:306 (-) comp15988_c0_seq1:3-920(-)